MQKFAFFNPNYEEVSTREKMNFFQSFITLIFVKTNKFFFRVSFTHCSLYQSTLHTSLVVMEVVPDRLGRLLGVGGHRLRGLADETGTTFTVVGEGQVSVFGPSQEAVEEFIERAENFLKEDLQVIS